MAIVATIGGSSGSGKGEISGSIENTYVEELGKESVERFDNGATYRMAVRKAILDGAQSSDEVISYALRLIDQNQPEIFLEEFLAVWNNPYTRKELRTPQVSGLVAHVGKQDEAQHFFTDLLNLRVQEAIGRGVMALVIDSRTPEMLISPTLESLKLSLAASTYMHTPAEVAAQWAFQKPGNTKSYDALLQDLRQRNYDDATRRVFPNFEPDENVRTEVTAQNIEHIVAQMLAGDIYLPRARFFVRNEGGIRLERLQKLGVQIAQTTLALPIS